MTLTYSNSNIYELYDRDFYLWIEETARLAGLKQKISAKHGKMVSS
ncbi:DUF29 domain-containing protein [Argonema galeatum]|nr:DUF29 domain-containing protein [Argonema galeatum]MCL1463979.1 DUF29 domain-containing protein [Argonema galeatum A003/A1]